MKEYLVEIVTTFPADLEQAEIDRLRAAEAVRAKELAATGHLVRLWRPVGEMRSIGVWAADDDDELRDKVLGTLPLHDYMAFSVTPVAPHPNDPGPHTGS